MPGIGELMILCVLPLIGLWIWMIVDCAAHEVGTERVTWLLVVVLAGVIGALIYLVVRKSQRPRRPTA